MHRNYFTLYHAAMELHEKLAGGRVTEICSEHKNELRIGFKTMHDHHMQLIVVTHSPQLSIYTKEGFQQKGKNSASLMSEVYGVAVTSVEIASSDRVIRIRLEDHSVLVLQLFHPKSNVFLVREHLVTDAFKHKTDHLGKPYPTEDESPGYLRTLETLTRDNARFISLFNHESGSTPQRLSVILPGFDRTLAVEVMKRADESESAEALFGAFRSLFYELLDPMVQVTEKGNGEPGFTLLHNAPADTGRYDSVLEGLSVYSTRIYRYLDTADELKAYRAKLVQQLTKTVKELEQYNPGLLEKIAANYDLSGHLLIASLYQERRDPLTISVKNILDTDNPESEVTITLKAALSLRENAEEYFAKASKTRGKLNTLQARQATTLLKKRELEALLAETGAITTPKEARRFIENHGGSGKKTGGRQVKGGESNLPFRSVQISPSITLLIGKNALNNELLTFSHSKPDDIWLHARGAAGSHCLLKGASLHHKAEIRKAAGIAAWYSAAKHSKLVPVIYTLKKYVRRGKRLAPGQVIVEREEVVMVRPEKEGNEK
ncbi:NFACT RNA binding domain-containing protein [Chlorobium ferrooxidans]|uniref:NFACT RNA-binding domain-containing protein n=1 Tax=Chlorobium ferrooxidans DSM 13031 TaxID=377431 RepID=Q0YQ35_9CHLB|nr:NFACT RNA binding domain-containing protein [Chlorobium ferrooxidans]EAT58436.1 Protein of unknown function DUF814 [Chlorobium ferrooxidans DSM 13031]